MNTSVPVMDSTNDVIDINYQNDINLFNTAIEASYSSLAGPILLLPQNLLSMVRSSFLTHSYDITIQMMRMIILGVVEALAYILSYATFLPHRGRTLSKLPLPLLPLL